MQTAYQENASAEIPSDLGEVFESAKQGIRKVRTKPKSELEGYLL